MSLKFYNNPPYYDDFDESKNYVRILFRPGHSVQARELTQMQTALQAQIDRHGRHTFQEGSPVLGGNMSIETDTDYIKLESSFIPASGGATLITDNYYEEFLDTEITGSTTGIKAKVIYTIPSEDSDSVTLYLKYINSGTDKVTKTFSALEEIVSNASVQRKGKIKTSAETPVGKGTLFSIDTAVFFVNGNFVYTPSDTLVLSKYSSTPSTRIVYEIFERVVTIAEDASLGDNALGSPNEAAPGAHRYQIELVLKTQPFNFDEVRDNNFIQLMLIQSGAVKERARTVYSELGNTLAQRTYEESGNYALRPFLLNMRELYNDGSNNGLLTILQLRDMYNLISETDNQVIAYGQNRLAIGLEKSVAYVNGYRIELEDVKYIDLLKSRETAFFNNASIVANLGNYVYVNLVQSLPDVDTFKTLNLLDSGDSVIGTARARSFEFSSGTMYKLYLFDVDMNPNKNFDDVAEIAQTITGGAQFQATFDTVFGAKLYETDKNSLVYQLPFNTVQSLLAGGQNDTIYTSKRSTYNVAVSSSTASITATDGVHLPNSSADWLATITTTGVKAPITNVSLDYNNSTGVSTATVTFDSGVITTGNVNIQYPIEKNLTRKTKNLVSNHEINVTSPNTTPGGYDSLSVTDVFAVKSIKDNSIPLGDSYLDITDRYEVENGQRDNFYDIGRIRLKSGSIAPSGDLEIVLDYYQHSSGDYFSVDSYTNTAYENIPSFNSSKGLIQLRDAIDFRPTKNNTGENFSGTASSSVDIVKPGSLIKSDITYYLNRSDKVYVDKYGKFGISEGVPALNPESAREVQDSMILYELFVGAYTFGVDSILPKMIDNKRYTMRDIGKIERRVKNLEYYTSLSLLEKETADYQVSSGSFKNGFIVDSFYGHNVGNPSHPDYSVSIDKSTGTLRPQFTETEVRLKLDSINTTGMRLTGPLLTLDYDEVSYISQPYASYSEFVNPYNIFSWDGEITLSPESDNWKDTDSRPEVVIDQEGIYDSFKDLADATGVAGTVWNEWQVNWSGVTASNTTSSTRGITTSVTTTSTTQTNQSRTGLRTEVVPDTVTTSLGDRVVEVNFIPFIRSRIVSFKAERMKPDTKIYAYFDGKDITNYATTTDEFFTFNDFVEANPQYTSGHTFNGFYTWPGDVATKTDLETDSTGSITGFFIIPNNESIRFKTGQRVFRLTDSADNIVSNTTTTAEAIYEASGLLESKENVILSTRVPRIERSNLNDARVLTSTTSRTSTSVRVTWRDPLAQTIMVDEPGGIFATSIDLFFSHFDENIPVTVHLVPTEVGLPTSRIIPFSRVTRTLTSDDVSEDASVATRFTFEAPVHLQQGVEYAIVIISMSDKPRAWVGEMGGFDVTNPTYRISKQPYMGVFFKSQNASTWTPEQEKDLKFNLNRADFETSGEVYMENTDLQSTKLGNDSLLTTSGSNTVRITHKNHGLFVNSKVVVSGVQPTATTFMNGIPLNELNKEHTITRVEKEYYEVETVTGATSTGRAGGNSIFATGNRLMNLAQFSVQELVIPGTNIDWFAKVTTGKSFAGSELPYSVSNYFPIISNQNTLFNRLQCVPSTVNQVGGVPGFKARGVVNTNKSTLSPVIDLDRVSVFAVANLIDNPSDTVVEGFNFVDNFVEETSATGGSAQSKYVTRRVSLAEDANQIKVILSTNRPSNTDIELYYKVQSASDANFDGLPWIAQQPDTVIEFSEDPNYYEEVEFTIDSELGGVEFNSMAFKIVLKSSNSSFVPTCKDFRAIAIYG